jgi:cytochrome P450
MTAAPIEGRFDPLSGDYLDDPYPFLAEARTHAPAFHSEAVDHWVVTRYEDVRHILRTPQVFSAANANSPIQAPCPHAARALQEGGYGAVPTLANVDPPAHTRVRALAAAAFTNRRVAAMEVVVRELVNRFLDAHRSRGHADLIDELCWGLPAQVLFRVLGLGDEHLDTVKAGSWARILFVYGRPDEETQVEAAIGLAAFWRFVEGLVAERADDPGDDYLSALLSERLDDGERLSRSEVATVGLNLLFAGHETTTGLLGNAFRRLLSDRPSWDRLRADPSMIPNAIEEVLRYDSSVIAWRRQATRATDIGGVAIPAGARLLLLLGSANRDPAMFEDPDRFDIGRPNARQHLSFGHGPHLCLGAPLARLQGRVVLEELTVALPDLELEPVARYEFAPNVSFRGPRHLPARWSTLTGDS